MKREPAAILAQEEMGLLQWTAIALCVLMTALDGFDILSISFAAPGIAAEWGIDRAALGVVLSMELIGMAAGSVLLGSLADRFGRRPAILFCLVVMASGMWAASQAGTVVQLSVCRLGTGLGIGGMLAASNAMAAELANARFRNLAVALMASGFPFGAAAGGTIASSLLAHGGWRDVFLFGALATALTLPPALLLMPESVSFLSSRPARDALARINRILGRMGHVPADSLPPPAPRSAPLAALFTPALAATTLLLAAAYFAHIMTFYFILKWVPKIVADLGFPPSAAGGVLVWANVGGAAGAMLCSLLVLRVETRRVVIFCLLLSCLMVSLFGFAGAELGRIAFLAGAAGCFTNGAVVGIYTLIARRFPSTVRAGGTGFVIGIGRGGAALGPVLAGWMFASGMGLPAVAAAMACGSLLAAAALWRLGPAQQDISH
jgi:benzoate transport